MAFLCILFMSPLYFLLRKRWGAFLINAAFYGLACLLVITIFAIMFAPIPWLIAVCHASFYHRREMMAEHAEMLATKMAEKMRQNEKPPANTRTP